MFPKNDLSNKKIWSNHARNNGENYDDCHVFSSQERFQQPHQSGYLGAETGYQQSPRQFIPRKGEPSNLSTDSTNRLGQWLNSLPDDFEMPQSPVIVRCLSDPVWRVMSDEEIAARGDGWNADYSLLKKMYENVSEETFSNDSELNNDARMKLNLLKPTKEEKVETLKYINDIIADESLHISASSNTTLCNTVLENGSIHSLNREYSESSTSSSSMMDAVCEGIHTSSAIDDTFYTATSRPQSVGKELTDNFNGFYNYCADVPNYTEGNIKSNEFRADVTSEDDLLNSALLKDLPSSYLTSQAQAQACAGNSNAFKSNLSLGTSKSSVSTPKIVGRGKPWTGHNKNFKSKNAISIDGNIGSTPQTIQPLEQWSPSPLVAVDSAHTTFVNAAYNNFITWQLTTAIMPNIVTNQLTLPQIAQILPLVPYLCSINLSNAITSSVPFCNNLVLYCMLQQQIIMQRQQQFTDSLMQQQQQKQHQQQHQHQNQHQRHHQYQRQLNFRNSNYKRHSQFSHKFNNLKQKPN